MRINPKLIYTTLRWVCLLYIIPIGYLAIVVRYREWFQGENQVWLLAFAKTQASIFLLQTWAIIWMVLFCILFLKRMREYLFWKGRLRDSISVQYGEEAEIFHDICTEMGIPEDTICLEQNVLITTPMIFGIRHPHIILPERSYQSEELRMIFYHELSHYKHKDLWMKQLTVWISIVHSMNPITYVLLKHISLWSECMADALALEISGNLHNAKPYYRNILRLIPDDYEMGKEKYVFSALFEKDDMLQKRIRFMKHYQQVQIAGTVLTTTITTVFIGLTTAIIIITGAKVADLHKDIYQQTEIVKDVTTIITKDGMIEYHSNVDVLNREGIQIVYKDENDLMNMPKAIEKGINAQWIVAPNTRYISEKFLISNMNDITIVGCLTIPDKKKYKIGIMNEDGDVRYVEGEGVISYNFTDLPMDTYRIFFQNDCIDGTVLTVNISYSCTYYVAP